MMTLNQHKFTIRHYEEELEELRSLKMAAPDTEWKATARIVTPDGEYYAALAFPADYAAKLLQDRICEVEDGAKVTARLLGVKYEERA